MGDMSTPKSYTPTDIAFLKAHYSSFGPKRCAKEMGRNEKSVFNKASELGLKMDPVARHELLSTTNSQHGVATEPPVKLETFSNVTTPEAAYILGLLWADGHVHPDKVTLGCLKDDALDFMPTFAATGTWRFSDDYPSRYGVISRPRRTIRLGYRTLAAYLISKGYRAKSNASACSILETIPTHLHSYWFRGLFDGDGHVRYAYGGVNMCIGSSYEQDWTYLERLAQHLDMKYRISRRRFRTQGSSGSYFITSTALSARQFFAFIYAGREQDGIGLNRKYHRWRDIVTKLKASKRVGHLFVNA
jgi:hypothetical protein